MAGVAGLVVGCVAGALEETEYASKLRAAGFTDVDVEPWRVYSLEDARAFLTESGLDVDRLASTVEGRRESASSRLRGCAAAPTDWRAITSKPEAGVWWARLPAATSRSLARDRATSR